MSWACRVESTLAGLSNTFSAASPCSLLEFQCNSGECTPRGWRCDQEEDCTDGSDELDCGGPCMLYQVPCAHSPHCVSPGQLCDGVTQCPDGSDEDPDVCGKSHIPYSVPSAGGRLGPDSSQALATIDWPMLWQFGAQLDCGWGYQRPSDWFGLVSLIFAMKSTLDLFFFFL